MAAKSAKANFIPKWQATTAYTAGQQVVSLDGDVVAAVADFTAGATFHPANWKYARFSDYFVNAKAFGAKGNGSANDTVAIQAALDAAAANPVAGQTGGSATCRPEPTSSARPASRPPRCQAHWRQCSRNQNSGNRFLPYQHSIGQAGQATDTVAIFGTTIETMRLWHGGQVGSIGVYSSEANELCGVYDVSIGNFKDAGIVFERIGTQDPPADATIERVYVNPSSSGANAGIRIGNLSGEGLIRNVTVDGGDVGTTQAGILVEKCGSLALMGIHAESCVYGIDVNGNADSAGTIIGVSGHYSNGTSVRLRATGGPTWAVSGLTNRGEPVTLLDEYNGVTLTDAQIDYYSQKIGTTAARLRDAEAFNFTNESSTQVATVSRVGSQPSARPHQVTSC